MNQKQIVFTVTNDLVYDQRMIRICTSLSKSGYKVILIGRKHTRSKKLDNQLFIQKRYKCFFEKGKLFYLEYNFRLFWILLFSKFDILCSIDLDTIVPGFLVAKLRNKILVYDAHEYFTEVPEVINRPMVKRIWEVVASKLIPRIKYCYTVCESLSEVFLEKYNTQFEVIRNVPFSKNFIPKQKDNSLQKIILYQGALNAGRGLEEAIKAMQTIEKAELWLAGEGDLSETLREQVKALGLKNKVIFMGYLKPDKLTEITKQAHIGLNLLENKSLNYYFSLANKAFDYIQAGVPAIHMNFPEYSKLNKAFEVAILIDKLDAKTIADTIKTLFENQDLYQGLLLNCEKAAKELTWENEERKLISFYKHILD